MKMKSKLLFVLFLGMMSSYAQTAKKTPSKTNKDAAPAATAASPKSDTGIFAEIETSKGKILLQLEYQKAPITVANFIALAEGTNPEVKDEKLKGKPFYNGLKFHRVIADFMIQGGDPQGNGSGGPGYAFKDEFVPELKFDKPGVLAMANSGPKTNGSQFFITHKATSWLDGKHTIFGHVITGQEVVTNTAQDDVITKITITRKGADAKKFDATKVFTEYFGNKAGDDAKQAAIDAENKNKQMEADALKQAEYNKMCAPIKAAKVTSLAAIKATATETPSGLKYKITQTGSGKKPVDGTTVYIHYAGYLEDGSLFDSSYEEVNKTYGKFDQNRASQNGYQPFPFQAGKKDGLIPGFIEGLSFMNFGDKAILFIPSKLGYGERGAGNVIPPNSNIIFEVELLEALPVKQ
jgi:peptidyl-prolyl cis-trans isomerase A (cyclophilin A)